MKKALFSVALFMAMVTTCFAETIISSINSVQLMKIMKENGYSVKLDDEADISWSLDGLKTFIIFNDGTKDSTNFYFLCSFTLDQNKRAQAMTLVNDYNRKKKFGKSYLTDDAVVYQLTLNISKGVTQARIVDFFDDCKVFMKTWKEEVVDKL